MIAGYITGVEFNWHAGCHITWHQILQTLPPSEWRTSQIRGCRVCIS